jgi:predicted dehydrogenase
MMRAAIVGCGKVADKHAGQILRIEGTQIVGVCDQEELMAAQLAERIGVGFHCGDIATLLSVCQPDVVHITTPPQSHYALAKQCLEAGCHVYVEKPFTLNSNEARDLIAAAELLGRKVTVGHETQFMPVAVDMRRLIQSGYLGGPPVHMESIYCYEFSDEQFAKALLGDQRHWVRMLPGGLLQNIISHGIGKIVEYLQDDRISISVQGFTSRFLEGIGEGGVTDELRVLMVDGGRTTAYFTFSSQLRPALHQFRVYGPRGSLIADHEHQTLLKVSQNRRSYLNQFLPPIGEGREQIANGLHNIRRFLRNDFHAEWGIHTLIKSFYRSISEDTPPPIPYRDILLTSLIMDEIFEQLSRRSAEGNVSATKDR